MQLLLAPTPPSWLPRVCAELDTLLLDLAHCEKRAASTVLSFLFRAPECGLADTFSRLAREELVHFEWCLRVIEARGGTFRRLPPARYAGALAAAGRRGDPLDMLVVAALIEARSGERLGLLAAAAPDADVRDLAARLYPPESRHHEIFWEAAHRFGDPGPRWEALAQVEVALVQDGEPLVRVHA